MTGYRALGLALALTAPTLAVGQESGMNIELNRMDVRGEGCRVHVVVTNKAKVTYTGFALDLVIFDKQQRIARRTAVDVAPVRSTKTTVYAFDVDDLKCDAMGGVLLNDVVDCKTSGGPMADCVDRVTTASKTATTFRK